MPLNSQLKTKTRVGRIRYTNCLPFYHRLNDFAPVSLHEAVPAEINKAMQEGKVDIAPISSLEYLNHQKQYVLLPNFIIGSRDFSRSVLLFSNEKIEDLNGAEIAVSQESLSSVALLRILLKSKYQFENTFTPVPSAPDEMLAKYKAALVIGDDALFYQPQEFIYKYDLSELWWNWTGKPFCFALWAVRRPFAEASREETAEFCRVLKKNLSRNLSNIETLIGESLQMTFMNEKFSTVFGYLFNLSYAMDPAMRQGLELFYRLAYELELAPCPEPLEFFE